VGGQGVEVRLEDRGTEAPDGVLGPVARRGGRDEVPAGELELGEDEAKGATVSEPYQVNSPASGVMEARRASTSSASAC